MRRSVAFIMSHTGRQLFVPGFLAIDFARDRDVQVTRTVSVRAADGQADRPRFVHNID
jgi:hypothetical protein